MSQSTRVLAVLRDRRPHSMEEIHQRAGFMRLNSRISELRDRGYAIECDKTGGKYVYRLTGTPSDTATSAVVAVSPGVSDSSTPLAADGTGAPEQLELRVA